MGEKIEPVMEIVDIISDAFKNLDIEPNIVPIRGGTDGSQLSYMGMPTPKFSRVVKTITANTNTFQ